jgi:hypothetical protein
MRNASCFTAAVSERRFWIGLLVGLAVLRFALVWLHPWPWLEGEEFGHLRQLGADR